MATGTVLKQSMALMVSLPASVWGSGLLMALKLFIPPRPSGPLSGPPRPSVSVGVALGRKGLVKDVRSETGVAKDK